MKAQFLKMGGVATEEEFYSKYPTEESFFEAFPQAMPYKKSGGIVEQFPQAEEYQTKIPSVINRLLLQDGGSGSKTQDPEPFPKSKTSSFLEWIRNKSGEIIKKELYNKSVSLNRAYKNTESLMQVGGSASIGVDPEKLAKVDEYLKSYQKSVRDTDNTQPLNDLYNSLVGAVLQPYLKADPLISQAQMGGTWNQPQSPGYSYAPGYNPQFEMDTSWNPSFTPEDNGGILTDPIKYKKPIDTSPIEEKGMVYDSSKGFITDPNDGQYKMKEKVGKFTAGRSLADANIAGMKILTNLLNQKDTRAKEKALRERTYATNIFSSSPTDNGDYDPLTGMFRPDQMVPVQFKGQTAEYGGQKYQSGGEYFLTDDLIKQIIDQGGEIEYID